MQSTKQSTWHVARKLAFRQIQRSSIWMNILTVAIMVLTFLNLVLITGILTGLTEGIFKDNRSQYTSDVFISALTGEEIIENSYAIQATLNSHPEVKSYTARYVKQATVEANYQTRWDFDSQENSVSLELVGIDPTMETEVTKLANSVTVGEYLHEGESGYILLGADNLAEYTEFSDSFDPLKNITPGTRVKVSFSSGSTAANAVSGPHGGGDNGSGVDRSGVSAEFIVKGIVESKVGQVAKRAYITTDDWNHFVGGAVDGANEFAVSLVSDSEAQVVADELKEYGLDTYAKIETAEEAIPSVLDDLSKTFGLLGNAAGGVAVVVSAITVFVVIYINALTRRKQIGILKGIGIKGEAIKRAYIMQSLFYAIVGSLIGYILIFFIFIPHFNANPIDFPVSDGILAATFWGTTLRAFVLVSVTAIAGYIPAWLIVRQNTLDSILGR